MDILGHCLHFFDIGFSLASAVANAYKTSTFDNVLASLNGKNPLQNNDLADSIEVDS